VISDKGVSVVREGESLEGVDSKSAGNPSVVCGATVEVGGVVDVNKLQAADTDKIANNARIREIFIFPPEKYVFIVFLFNQKENPRPERDEGVVIR